MTKKEALSIVEDLQWTLCDFCSDEQYEAMNIAIETLEQSVTRGKTMEDRQVSLKQALGEIARRVGYLDEDMLNGFNPACLIAMPMLGRKQEEYPRFRGCFIENGKIAIYTRVGGGNRGCGYGEEKLYKDPNFVSTYDDDFDSTYATYLFNVPKKWEADFEKITQGDIKGVSDEYYDYVCEFYPLLAEKGVIKAVFREDAEGAEQECG